MTIEGNIITASKGEVTKEEYEKKMAEMSEEIPE